MIICILKHRLTEGKIFIKSKLQQNNIIYINFIIFNILYTTFYSQL